MFEIEKDVDLKDFCSFRIGGKAKFLFVAHNTTTLVKVCYWAKTHNIKHKIIGLGANLLFDDLGYDGLIVVNKTDDICFALGDTLHSATSCSGCHSECSVSESQVVRKRLNLFPNGIEESPNQNVVLRVRGSFDYAQDDSVCAKDDNVVYVDSGVHVTNLIMKCCMRSLCGFERLAGIPSTVGGAVVNSLGAFDTNFSDFVEYVECYHKSDLIKKLKLSHDECQFGYRTSLFKSGDYIITKVKLKLFEDNQTLIQKRIQEAVEKKKSTQPLDYPSAGSVFKRTNIIPAKVIDELGLKGTKIGGAEISMKHAGFIINSQSATSKDVKKLISLIQDKVKSATNEDLSPEIEFVEY